MADILTYNSIMAENERLKSEIEDVKLQALLDGLSETPWETANWAAIPLLANPTGCLCVYDSASGYFRCGACCLWTVPEGATKVQFQLWGAGAGAARAYCCGGNPFGATGAFATVIIDATPGDQYTLCAGCAYCCYAEPTAQNTTTGCPSYVIGPKLTGFCADGGCAATYRAMQILNGNNGVCRYQAKGYSSAGPCICASGTYYCFDNSCATCGEIPFQADPDLTYHGTAVGSIVWGLPSILGSGCLTTDNYGYHEHPPLIGPCHTAQPNSYCCSTFTSNTCLGYCYSIGIHGNSNVLCYPGAGGFRTHAMGGCTSGCGDSGKTGMVRVTWC